MSSKTSAHSVVGVVLSRKVLSPENAPASSKFWITLNLVPLSKFMPPFEKSITPSKFWPLTNDSPAPNCAPTVNAVSSA